MFKNLFVLAAIVFCTLHAIEAQDLASLTVTAVDPSGAMVPAAKLVLIDLQRGVIRQAEANAGGFAVFDMLATGDYSLEVDKPGFNKYRLERLILNLRDRQTLRVEMRLSPAAGTTVSVTDKAEVLSSDAAVGVALGQEFVQNLPLNGRNAESLIAMTPGITTTGGGGPGGGFNANGLRSNTNYYTLDGVSVNSTSGGGPAMGRPGGGRGGGMGGGTPIGGGSTELISIDSMQEMKVQTSSFAPEFGRSPGAQIVMSSRGGTNNWHGSLFYFLRNDRFDANDWFANSGGYGKGEERQNRPGGTLGGPIQRDRTFFFASFEHLQLMAPYTVIANVPDLASRRSASAALRPYLNAFPIPNGPTLENNAAQYRAVVSNPMDSDTGSLRIDHILNAKTTLFARYSFTPSSSEQRGSDTVSPNVITSSRTRSHTATGGMTQTLGGGGVNDVRVNYSKLSMQSWSNMDNFGGAVPITESQAFPTGITSETGSFNLTVMGLSGYSVGARNQNEQQQINVVDSLTKVEGAHQFKAGVDYRMVLATNFRKSYTSSVSFNGASGNNGGLLTGVALNGQVASNVPAVYPTYTNSSAYAQDTWRVSQWTTITYGLRWDINPAPYARQGERPFAQAASTIAGVTQNEPMYKTRWFDIAPRLGLAYNMDERPGRELIFRSGVGLFYDTGYGMTGAAFGGAPYSSVRTMSLVTFPFTTADRAAPALPPTRPYGQITTADTNLKSPVVFQWNTSLERYFGTGQMLSVGYVGTAGRRLTRTQTQASFSDAYDVLTLSTNGATSIYHGLQVQFRKRVSRALQLQVSYTYAHAIDSSSNDAGSGGGGGFASLFGSGERGSSDYDIRHSLSISGSYRLPARQNGFVWAPLRDWFLDFVETARTGTPFSIQGVSTDASTTSSSGRAGLFAQVRPNYNGQPVWIADPTVPGGMRVNQAAFETPAGFSQGNLGRNTLRGFGFNQLDLSLRRMISLTERCKLNIAAQGFNILNHPNFANISALDGGNMSSPNFGVVTRMMNQSSGGGVGALYRSGGARSMELSLRLQF
jgi:hypothetical protein